MKLTVGGDPIQGLLQAAELRYEAHRLEEQAELHERIAINALEDMGIHPNIHHGQRDTVLVVAYGGPANGVLTRVSTKAFPDNVALVADGQPFEYTPGVMFTIGNVCPCALVVPKVGGLASMYRDMAKMGKDEQGQFDALATSIVRTLLHGVGYHPHLFYQPVQSLARAAVNPDVVLESPAIISLQGSPA